MAVLHNNAKNLRFFLEVVDREVLPPIPGQPSPRADAARILGTTGVEFYDRRDKGFWPFVRLPVLYLAGTDGHALIHSLRDLCSQKVPGFAFRTGTAQEVAIQVGQVENGRFLVEVGIDLAAYLLETSGTQGEAGQELALFRFHTHTAELVLFADQVKQELERLPPVRGGS
jgi:hypothetical protein